MRGQLSDSDRLVFFILGMLLLAVMWPALPFVGLILVLVGIYREKKKIIYSAAAVFGLLMVLFMSGDLKSYAAEYIRQLVLVYGIVSGYESRESVKWSVLIYAGIPTGVVAALVVELVRASRPEWTRKEYGGDRGKAPDERRLKERLKNLRHLENGTLLGVSTDGKPVYVSDGELNGHCLVLGATGAGKTTTLMNFIESACVRGIPLILVDGKGEREFLERVKKLAARYGRKFYGFSMAGEGCSMHYNPLRHGNYTELKDKLIAITEWTEPHYKLMAERYLQSSIRMLQMSGVRIDLGNIADMLDPGDIVLAARKLAKDGMIDEYELKRFAGMVDESKRDISGLVNRIAVFAESEIGYLLKDTDEDEDITIDLVSAIHNDGVVFFSLDSLRFPEYSRLLGRLIVIDLKTVAARMFGRGKKVFSIFDEFGVFAGIQVTDYINKSRGAGFHVILSTQELADLRTGGDEELMEQVLGNTNVKIIHRQDVPASAELLSSLIGTREDMSITRQINEAGATGMGTISEQRSFIVHPDEIKRLEVGEAFVLKKFPKFEVDNIKIRSIDC
jgi:hypothetical protein